MSPRSASPGSAGIGTEAPVRVRFFGGLSQIGRNCAAIEADGKLLLIDCGQMFSDDASPGVETILPDFGFLRDRAADIVGCIATHGHEDHIGALPFLLRDVSFPVYSTRFTLALVRHKLAEANLLDRSQLVEVHDGEKVKIGPFDCEFLPVTHSTPSGVISVIRTSQGVIVHSGDLKIDPTPVDHRTTDLDRLAEIASTEGVRLLLADSTNADTPGRTASETHIGDVLSGVFAANSERRIIVASFASHIHRLQQVADLAIAQGRTVVPVGLSMVRNFKLARDLGLMHIPDQHIADALHASDVAMRTRFAGWMSQPTAEGGLGLPPELARTRALSLQCFIEGLAIRAIREPELSSDELKPMIEQFITGLAAHCMAR